MMEHKAAEERRVDTSLIDWFLSLSHEQRLAGLESRIAPFRQADDSAES